MHTQGMMTSMLLAGLALSAHTLQAQVRKPLIGTIDWEHFHRYVAQADTPALRILADERLAGGSALNIKEALLCRAVHAYWTEAYPKCLSLLDSTIRMNDPEAPRITAIAHKYRAQVLGHFGHFAHGLAEAENALLGMDSLAFPVEYVDLLVVVAEALTELERSEQAMLVLARAQRSADAIAYKRGSCWINTALGNILFLQGRYHDAMTRYKGSLELAREQGLKSMALAAVNNIAACAAMAQEHDRALDIYSGLLSASQGKDVRWRLALLTNLGYIQNARKNYAHASAALREAFTIGHALEDTNALAKTHQHYATTLWNLNDRENAFLHADTAIRMSLASGREQWASEVHRKKFRWNRSLNRLDAAIEDLEAHRRTHESVTRKRYSEQLAFAENLFEAERKQRRINEQQSALEQSAGESRRKTTQRNALIGTTLLLSLTALFLIRSIRARKRLSTKEKELHDEQIDQLLSQQEIKSMNAMLEGQEKERDRVAKDLHDRLGSMLGGIKANMAALEDRVEEMRQDQQYQKVNRLLDHAVGELRQISHDMAAATLSRFGLEKALRDLCDTIHINGRLSVELKTFGLDQRLERSVELAIYRMVQELVGNVLKHAQAQELSIAVTRSPGRLSVVVADDGTGFDTTSPSEGIGLGNVRSRAAAIGATVHVDSTIGKGTTVSVECPVVE